MSVRLAVLLALLAFPSVGCSSTPKEPEARWRTIEVEAPSDRMVWQLSLLALQNTGYPLASGTDSGARQVESGWKTDMQPFRGDGVRRRATIRLSPLEPGRWKLEARVKSEHNDNLVSPLDPTRAEWKPAPDDEQAAQILLMHVRARLKPAFELAPPPAPPEKRIPEPKP